MHSTADSARAASTAAPVHATTNLREFLAFKLGAEEYGIDILRVQEIRSYEEPTRIANAPDFVKGVVNLRGVIVPIVDLRLQFNLEQVNYDSFTVVIVLNVRRRVVGIVVDGVSDVITLTPEQLRPVPEFNSTIQSDHLLAIGSVDERMLILVDIEKLMSSSEMGLVEQTLQ
jgi:purine-binding chemotaxis protein CheW